MVALETSGPAAAGAPRSTVAALSACTLLAAMGTSMANALLPGLATHFGASLARVQPVVLAYLLALTAVIVYAGRLGDVHGRRRVLAAGITVFSIASIACALAPTLAALALARAVQGAGAAAMMALSMALLRDAAPAAQAGRAMGLLATTSAFGTALGPALGGALAAASGWRAAFAVLALLALGTLVLARRDRSADTSPGARPRTASGTAHGMRRLPARNLATNALVSAVMMATLVVGPFYLARGLALGEAGIGLVLSVGPVASIACGIPAGRAVDRFGARAMMLAGLLALGAGSLALVLLPAAVGLAGYVAAILVLAPGYQLFQAANNVATLDGVEAARRGAVSGLLTLSRNIGLLAGASLMPAIFALASRAAEGRGAPAEAATSGLQATFATAAGVVAIAFAFAARSPDRR